MEVELEDRDEGTEINVKTEKQIAVVVYDGEEERIYLPEQSSSDSTYYIEESESLVKTENGYRVLHPGKVKDLEVLS